MTINIIETTDANVLAILNHDVQEIHYNIEPKIFKPYSEEGMEKLFENMLKEDEVNAYLAYYNDEIAGYMILTRKEQKESFFRFAYSAIHIDQICVEKSYKGKGIGKALVDFAIEHAKRLNIDRIEMNYWTQNANSGEFFRSQGFESYNERLALKI